MKKAENFHNVLNFIGNFTISRMRTRTQIFPKMDKNDLLTLGRSKKNFSGGTKSHLRFNFERLY
jgi:hypothetical protein